MFNINRYIKKLACSVFAASAAVLQIKHLSAKKFSKCDVIVYNRDLTQNRTATATRTSPNRRFNEQNNGCARAL